MENIARYILLLVTVLMLLPSPASAAAQQFTPRIAEYTGTMDVNMDHRRDDAESNGEKEQRRETNIEERLNLAANGFVYHPRFLIFLTSLSLGLEHQKVQKNKDEDPSWNHSPAEGWEFRTTILPEHPYNLELFTMRSNYVSRTFEEGQPTTSSNGAIFNYRERPVTLKTSYILTTLKSSFYSSESKVLNTTGGYSLHNFHTFLGYSRTDSDSDRGIENRRDYYFIQNLAQYKKLSLDSRISKEWYRQQSSISSSIGNTRVQWTEHLNVPLPWNFHSSMTYTRRNEKMEMDALNGSVRETESDTESKAFVLTHRLFRSLATNFTLNKNTTDSNFGTFTTTSKVFSTMYTKEIPRGRLILSGNADHTITNRAGTPSDISVLLNGQIIAGSIELRIAEPAFDQIFTVRVLNPDIGEPFFLDSTQFTVTRSGATTLLRVSAINPFINTIAPPKTYAFEVTYALLPDTVKLKREGYGYGIKLSLFDELLTPYYEYSTSNQEVLSGTLTGGAEDTTTESYGISVLKRPYSFSVDRIVVRSSVNPYKQLSTVAEYRETINETTQVNARLYYTRSNFTEETSEVEQREITEHQSGIDATVIKFIPKRKLSVQASSSFFQRIGTQKGKTFLVSSSLSWSIGRFILSLGGNVSLSKSEGENIEQKLLSQRYYMNISRQLF